MRLAKGGVVQRTTVAYVAVAMALGVVWLLANPYLKRADRGAEMYLLYMAASATVALALRSRIERASGLRLWGLGALVPVLGHFLVLWGLVTILAVRDHGLGSPTDSPLEGVLKSYVFLPVMGLAFTVMAAPIYAPLGALYVYTLRAVPRAPAAVASRVEARAPEAPDPRDQRTLASAVRLASAVVVARAATPFFVTEQWPMKKGPPFRWNVLRLHVVDVVKSDGALPGPGGVLEVSLYDMKRQGWHEAYYEHGISLVPALDPADRPYPTRVQDVEREAAQPGVILFLARTQQAAPDGREGYRLVYPAAYEPLAALDEVRRELAKGRE